MLVEESGENHEPTSGNRQSSKPPNGGASQQHELDQAVSCSQYLRKNCQCQYFRFLLTEDFTINKLTSKFNRTHSLLLCEFAQENHKFGEGRGGERWG
jgi:5-methylcytosine-specific restriction endonuclease McrA